MTVYLHYLRNVYSLQIVNRNLFLNLPIISESNSLVEEISVKETRYKECNHGMLNITILSNGKYGRRGWGEMDRDTNLW